ncbi:MAG: Gfo/Idh/MocA family protein [Gemmatimonadaceae bacterium]
MTDAEPVRSTTRIAVVGLGSIAQKAYLPVLTARDDVELVFCTRNQERLRALSRSYRVSETAASVDDLLGMHIDAAFVHTSTESHVAVSAKLLRAGIHVYVDKPIAYSYGEAERLVEIAETVGRILMVGFNRRFAPMYSRLQETCIPRMVLLQKNRTLLPEIIRSFVFDDFIHVIDTLRFFAPTPVGIENVRISGRVCGAAPGGQLHDVIVQLDSGDCSMIGIMNRDSGITEEILEVMAPGNKWLVRGLSTTVYYADGEEAVHHFGNWETVLYQRGFPQIVQHFLDCVRENGDPAPSARDSLETHALCERIVEDLERRVSS